MNTTVAGFAHAFANIVYSCTAVRRPAIDHEMPRCHLPTLPLHAVIVTPPCCLCGGADCAGAADSTQGVSFFVDICRLYGWRMALVRRWGTCCRRMHTPAFPRFVFLF